MKSLIKKAIGFYLNSKNKTRISYMYINLNTKIGIGSIIMDYTKIDLKTKIGMHSYIGYNCTITKTIIGNYCGVGDNVVIGPGEHNLHNISLNLYEEHPDNNLTIKNCNIGHDVWIGANAVILRGVTIGNGAVIGAGSVVTKDIPAYAIAVGIPARIMRYRFDKVMIDNIESSQWFLQMKRDAIKTISNIKYTTKI